MSGGVDLHENPVTPVTMSGAQYAPYAHNMLGYNPSRVLTIDSRDRDRCRYPSANEFSVRLQREFKKVYSIALRMAIVPAVESTTEHYCVLRSDSLNSDGQNLIQGAVSTDREQRNPVFDRGFAIVPFRRDLPFEGTPAYRPGTTVYTPTVYTKQFSPPLASLDRLDFVLLVRGNGDFPVLHPLPKEPPGTPTDPRNNVLYVLEIVSAV